MPALRNNRPPLCKSQPGMQQFYFVGQKFRGLWQRHLFQGGVCGHLWD
jgi:hypothetical protein